MRLAPTDEQAMLRDTVARFLADRGDAAAMGAGPMSQDGWRGLAELGVLAFLSPERGGGMGGGADDAMIVADALGRALAITPLGEAILGAGDLIARHGNADMIDRFVTPLIAGEGLVALAEGRVEAEGGRVHGTLPFVRWAPQAIALAVLDGDAAHVVALEEQGVAIDPVRLADGTPAAQVRLNGAAGERIDLPQGAAATMLATVDLVHAAEMTGIMALLCAQTADYAATRRQFGSAIGTFQAVQHKQARMFVALEQSRSLTIKAAATGRDDPGFVRAARAAKAYVADAAQRLAEDAVQLHGGIGVTDELPVGRALRRVMVLGRLFGGAAAARAALAA